MSQADILMLLRKNAPRWLTLKEIAETIGADRLQTSKQLTKLARWFDEVEVSSMHQDYIVMDPRTESAIKRKVMHRIARSKTDGRTDAAQEPLGDEAQAHETA